MARALEDRRDWLLKDPAHLFSLEALFAAFPRARVVWTHREPKKVAPSICSLLAHVWTTVHRTGGAGRPDGFRRVVVECETARKSFWCALIVL